MMRYAGFWRRLAAYGVDATIVHGLTFLALWLLGGAALAQTATDYQTLVDMGWLPAPQPGEPTISEILAASGVIAADHFGMGEMLVLAIIAGIYQVWFVAGPWQATPGKRWCGLKVVTQHGAPLTLAQSALRWFASGISWIPLGFGYFLIGWNREKCAMHDVICGTRVVYRDEK